MTKRRKGEKAKSRSVLPRLPLCRFCRLPFCRLPFCRLFRSYFRPPSVRRIRTVMSALRITISSAVRCTVIGAPVT
jgi:hypothetical protein